jgi:hypothetical protein
MEVSRHQRQRNQDSMAQTAKEATHHQEQNMTNPVSAAPLQQTFPPEQQDPGSPSMLPHPTPRTLADTMDSSSNATIVSDVKDQSLTEGCEENYGAAPGSEMTLTQHPLYSTTFARPMP